MKNTICNTCPNLLRPTPGKVARCTIGGEPSSNKTSCFNGEYELALRIGNKRFGSECKHEHVTNGHCANCLRSVVN